MTDAVLQIESSAVEDAGAIEARIESPEGESQTPRVVSLNVFSIPGRARAAHEDLTFTSRAARMAFFDDCPLWDTSTKERLRPVVEYSVSRIRPRDARAAVASQAQEELNVMWAELALIISVLGSMIVWRHGALVLLLPVIIVALCVCLGTLWWNLMLMTRRSRWQALLYCFLLGAALPVWLAYLTGNRHNAGLWLSDGVRTGLLAGAVGALGLLVINGAYSLYAVAVWRRKCSAYPVEELIDSLLYMLEGIAQRRSQPVDGDEEDIPRRDAMYHEALHYSFGFELVDTLEYTALVAENEWQRTMVRAHPPAKAWLAERAAAMAGALRSWKPYVVFNDDRLDDLSADLALAVTSIASGNYAAVCSSDAFIGQRDAGKGTRTKITRAALSLLLPLLVAASVLQSNVAPAVAGSVVSLCLAFPLIQLLHMLDPKSGDKLASAIDMTQFFRPSS